MTKFPFIKHLFLGISFSILLIFSIFGLCVYQLYNSPMLPASFRPVTFTVYPNQSANRFIQRLADNQWVQTPRILSLLLRCLHYDHNLQVGIYKIDAGETVMQFIDAIAHGKVLQLPLRIPEGSTFAEIKNIIALAPFLVQSYVIPSEERDLHKFGIMPIAGDPSSQTPRKDVVASEGLLLADTYYYGAGSSSSLVLKQAHQALLQYLNKVWNERDPTLPYRSAYELLIVASILEKEASLPQERRIISGIVINRLSKHMRLQMDPTVIYALGSSFLGKLTYKDLKYQSPYNTYVNMGLPPTPISMVSKDAIEAAGHPEKSAYLYYVAKGDGSHKFSTTYKDQQQAIREIRK